MMLYVKEARRRDWKNTFGLILPSHYVVSLSVIFGAQQGNNSAAPTICLKTNGSSDLLSFLQPSDVRPLA